MMVHLCNSVASKHFPLGMSEIVPHGFVSSDFFIIAILKIRMRLDSIMTRCDFSKKFYTVKSKAKELSGKVLWKSRHGSLQ